MKICFSLAFLVSCLYFFGSQKKHLIKSKKPISCIVFCSVIAIGVNCFRKKERSLCTLMYHNWYIVSIFSLQFGITNLYTQCAQVSNINPRVYWGIRSQCKINCLQQYISCCIYVSVMVHPAIWTRPFTYR